jgi:hypothetical protein
MAETYWGSWECTKGSATSSIHESSYTGSDIQGTLTVTGYIENGVPTYNPPNIYATNSDSTGNAYRIDGSYDVTEDSDYSTDSCQYKRYWFTLILEDAGNTLYGSQDYIEFKRVKVDEPTEPTEPTTQYLPPIFSDDAKAVITTKSGSSTLTLDEPWVLSWDAAELQNDNGTVSYDVYFSSTASDLISLGSTTRNYIEEFNPKNYELFLEDSFMLVVYAETITETGQSAGKADRSIESDVYRITNKTDGVKIGIKVNGTWLEGDPWVKDAGVWKKGTAVYIKTTEGWIKAE